MDTESSHEAKWPKLEPTPTKRNMPKLFLSHSSKDKEFARKIAKDLVKNGFEVWFDEWEIMVGESISQKIEKGLEDSDFVAVLLSSNSVKSGWVKKEWQSRIGKEAKEKKVHILPLKLEQCIFPNLLVDKKYADFSTDYENGLIELLSSIDNLIETRESRTYQLNNNYTIKAQNILIVEDDISVCNHIKEIFSRYEESINVKTANNAGDAFEIISSSWGIDAVVLDIMLPYGSASELLNEKFDPEGLYAGFRLLEIIRNDNSKTWAAVITARNSPKIVWKINDLLGDCGKIYFKPFDTFLLEHETVNALGILSKVPAIFLKQ